MKDMGFQQAMILTLAVGVAGMAVISQAWFARQLAPETASGAFVGEWRPRVALAASRDMSTVDDRLATAQRARNAVLMTPVILELEGGATNLGKASGRARLAVD